ncbi:ras-associating and dilute domain-containing protein [Lampris incognitus]|uniref:ras-associating and dilute domain-containing protein n=1 Tax=Lampris incognitus TaxID=2546036 RepID=UPI0024B57BB3|nr:ras-associating and dilute domain-containing protein [Lampris incognitus]
MSPEDLSLLPARRSASLSVSLPAASPKRRFVRMGGKPSDGCQQCSSSSGRDSSVRSVESAGVPLRQPGKSRIRHHTDRFSGVFLRGPSSGSGPMALTTGLRSTLSSQRRKDSMAPGDTLVADDPSELSNQITAPGILKIFGSEICQGAHYKSVLATTHSSAKELVKEALERYGLGKEKAGSYVLCDAIGSIIDRQWKTEGFRVVGDNEKPLLLQSLWKPREGLARRFEIQRRSVVDEKRSKEKDTVTAGINAQARKLQKSRSRVTSTLIEKTMCRNQFLWRSKSEMDLLGSDAETQEEDDQNNGQNDHSKNHSSAVGRGRGSPHNPKPRPKQNPIQSQVQGLAVPSEGDAGSGADTEGLCPLRRRAGGEREESEREETESSDDSATQYSIHPPQDCPYLLLLQGYSLTQDFVIYLLTGPSVVIGRSGEREEGVKTDILLFAPDVLPRHCCLQCGSGDSPTLLHPCKDAVVTRNGVALKKQAELRPGDIIGLGQCYLFLFSDPLAVIHKEANYVTPEPSSSPVPLLLRRDSSATATANSAKPMLCNTCISTYTVPQNPRNHQSLKQDAPFLRDPGGRSLMINYDARLEDRIVAEIIAMGSVKGSPALTVAFLLCVRVQYSAAHLSTSDLRRLLLLIAAGVQTAMWEHTKELAAVQPKALIDEGTDPEEQRPLSLEEVMSGLRPLVVWMSNALELLYLIQHQLPLILEWRTRREQGQEDEEETEEENLALLELRLSCVRSASEETMAVLEEVIMLTFQQCVYYITKVLYPVLPGVLDCNPFREGAWPHKPGHGASVLEALTVTRRLLLDCQVHPEVSSQLLAYLFYFINASLLNSLMERGSEAGFYHWSRGVCIRANLDMLLDWAHQSGFGLGELAVERTHTLSSAVNLLATPRENLLQTSWAALRSDYPALRPAQLHHLLTRYSPASPCPHNWAPSAQDQHAARTTADILEGFDTYHPLVLPGRGYRLELRGAVIDTGLRKQLARLRAFISTLSDSQSNGDAAVDQLQGCASPTNARVIKMDVLPKASLESLESLDLSAVPPAAVQTSLSPSPTSAPSPLSSSSSSTSTHCPDEFGSRGALLLSQRLKSLELQAEGTETAGQRRSALDASCLLTPPNTPQNLELINPDGRAEGMRDDGDERPGEVPWSTGVDLYEEGGLVLECLAALTTDCLKLDSSDVGKFVELKEEEEEEEKAVVEEEIEEENDDRNPEEVFMVELERSERGLGLALVDARDTPLRMNGILIRAVMPDSPAARCEKLVPFDRILAVNGISLIDLDYHSGKELIQSSGDRPRLLVARSDWMAEALRTKS